VTTPPLPELDVASYRHNVLRLELPQGAIDLEQTEGPSCALLPGGPMHVLSVWNPYGRPSTLRENLAWDATELHEPYVPAAIYAPDLRFAEQAVAVQELQEAEAQPRARRFGQPAFLRWDAEGVHVIRTADLAVVDSWAVRSRVGARSCVMEPDRVDGRCARRGGPWTGGSIRAAFRWQHERDCMLTALRGCDLCGGRAPGPGEAIGLVELSVPSRFAAIQVLGPARPR
jgi:hypothetical protein